MPFYVYILRSLKDGLLYTGMSQDPQARLRQHNSGKTRSLKHRRPLTLVYLRAFETRSEAISFEYYLKTPEGGSSKAELIEDFARNERARSGPYGP